MSMGINPWKLSQICTSGQWYAITYYRYFLLWVVNNKKSDGKESIRIPISKIYIGELLINPFYR